MTSIKTVKRRGVNNDTFCEEFISTLSCYNSKLMYNLNLPETQTHSYHLFEEQQVYYRKLKKRHRFSNGYSVLIPVLLSMYLSLTCFFFVNYLWGDQLYLEVSGHFQTSCRCQHHMLGAANFVLYLMIAIWILFFWFENIRFESNQGYHIAKVNTDYKIAFLLFLMSEAMFFFSVFWAFFHFSLSSNLDLGYMWPPIGIEPISFSKLPLVNTIILITSGLFVTWSHNSLKVGKRQEALEGLRATVWLGVLFLICQIIEYNLSNFNINDSVFGSIFFFGTGFHGLHVLLGTLSLIYNLLKLYKGELSSYSHYSYLFTIWYWHFVDLVWLKLFIIFYIWGQ